MRRDPAGTALPVRSGRPRAGRCLLAVASGLAVVLAAGCSSSGSPGGTVAGVITIAAVPGVNDAPIYLAEKDGLFAAEGLGHVTIRTYSSFGAELTALQSGQADIAVSDYGDIFYAESQSDDLRILADGYDATQGVLEVLTLPSSAVKTPADLTNPGVQVGLPNDDVLPGLLNSGNPPSLEAAAATEVLSNYVGNAALGVQWDNLPQQQEVAELKDGQLQAILVSEPYIYEAESELGAVELMDACSGFTSNLPLYGYVATSSWVNSSSAAVADFRAALTKAQSEAAMTGEVQKILPASTGMSTEDADMVTVGTYPTTTSATALQTVLNVVYDYHMLKTTNIPSLSKMLVTASG